MKVLILVLTLSLGISHPVLSQEIDSLSQRETLLELSKKQKKTGFILLGAGVGAAVIGGALFASNFCLWGCDSNDEALAGTGGILFILGVGSAIASVPVLINSGSTAKRAMELSVQSTPIFLPPNSHNGPKSHPSLQLTIPLNR
jgi:hypothetical protein